MKIHKKVLENGRIEYRLNGELHREDGPAREDLDGSKSWHQRGRFHRNDGPAVIYASGEKHWYQEGYRHREDGPAIEKPDGTKYWYRDHELHREDGPAVEKADGSKEWHLNGKLHRKEGPAIEGADFYLDGVKITKNELDAKNAVDPILECADKIVLTKEEIDQCSLLGIKKAKRPEMAKRFAMAKKLASAVGWTVEIENEADTYMRDDYLENWNKKTLKQLESGDLGLFVLIVKDKDDEVIDALGSVLLPAFTDGRGNYQDPLDGPELDQAKAELLEYAFVSRSKELKQLFESLNKKAGKAPAKTPVTPLSFAGAMTGSQGVDSEAVAKNTKTARMCAFRKTKKGKPCEHMVVNGVCPVHGKIAW